ncbi:MAG TPA: four helix bundle protein [Candidatus Acidoferrales bacterium]|nr:four helix bundle protein [Candidatus Acidoferrales bacterium]
MKIERFSDLTVWQEGHKLALNAYRLTDNFPSREQFGIVAQIRPSAASVCANIAEGFGRRTTRELLRSLQVARGELEETRYFLILSRDLGHVKGTDFEAAIAQCESVAKLINALGSSLKNRL